VLVAEGKRMPLGPHGGVIGRSRDCDIVLADSNVSRRHAEIRPDGRDGWVVTDLGSTNGVRVNGRPVEQGRPAPLRPGDQLDIGTVDARFEVQ
jgi:pSer/pThr/pTyr-binding forkhead associated (FHA) protein